jgi:thioesterase domain-containing protein
LFKAEEVTPFYQPYVAPLNHWENYSTYPVELCSVPGDHETMFHEQHATALNKALNECLNNLEITNEISEKIIE